MRAIGNFLWFILGGALMGLAWWLVGVVAFMSIVGIPWGRACFVIGQFSFFPFGKEAISRKELKQTDARSSVWSTSKSKRSAGWHWLPAGLPRVPQAGR